MDLPSMAVVLLALDHLCLGMGRLMRAVDMGTIRSIDIMRDGTIGIHRGRRIIQEVRVRRVIVVMGSGDMEGDMRGIRI
jgi:hypothetical protein